MTLSLFSNSLISTFHVVSILKDILVHILSLRLQNSKVFFTFMSTQTGQTNWNGGNNNDDDMMRIMITLWYPGSSLCRGKSFSKDSRLIVPQRTTNYYISLIHFFLSNSRKNIIPTIYYIPNDQLEMFFGYNSK